MNTGRSSSENWKGLFQAALLELDKTKLPERIRDAQQAIVEYMEEFFKKETTTPGEHQMLYDALTSLRALQRLYQQSRIESASANRIRKYRSA